MYKVVIVEDEMLVSIGLRNLIQWSDLDMRIVGTAANGRGGLELYRQNKPDIILTDIRMPVMDGIEMIRIIRETDKTTKIVVLTSYDDFELVRQAFQLGISDYIRKLKMLPEDIRSIMKKLQLELNQERLAANEADALTPPPADKRDKLRDYVIKRTCGCEEFRAAAQELNLDETEFAVGVAGFTEDSGSGKSDVIENTIQEILAESHRGVAVSADRDTYLLFLQTPDALAQTGRDELVAVLERIRSVAYTYTSVNLQIGISGFNCRYDAIEAAYSEALEAYEAATLLDRGLLFYGADEIRAGYERSMEELGERVAQTEALSENCREKLYGEIAFQKRAQKLDTGVLRESFCRWIHRVSFDCFAQREDMLKRVLDATAQIRSSRKLSNMIITFERFTAQVAEVKERKLASVEVSRAIIYIREHFSEEDISLSRVAEVVCLNKEYLSSQIKKETGVGFSEHVNRMRIHSAQKLLETTELRNYEIAVKTGFQDEGYFGRVFKKYVGMTPNEYKKRILDWDASGGPDPGCAS